MWRRNQPTVLVAVEGRSRMADGALQFAMTLSPDVVAVHHVQLAGPEPEDDGAALKQRWHDDVVRPAEASGLKAPQLLLLPALYRELHEPFLELIAQLDEQTPGRSVAVLIPELVKRRWWERVLHNHRAERLRKMLIKHGGPRVNVIIAPWRI